MLIAWGKLAQFAEDLHRAPGHGIARVHDVDLGELGANVVREEMVVGAAEHHGIGASGDLRPKHLAQDHPRLCGADLALLDDLGKTCTGHARDPGAPTEVFHDARVEFAIERPGGGEDRDATAFRAAGGGLHTGNHSHEGQIEHLAEVVDGSGGGCVAGHNHHLYIALKQTVDDREGALAHFGGWSRPVWEVAGVGEVDDPLRGRESLKLAQYAQSTNTGIEDADGTWIHRRQHITAPPPYLLIGDAVAVTRSIDIARLPADARKMQADCYIVVDVLRATTTIATLFAAGMESLLVAGDIELARSRARTENHLLFGEVHGVRPEGFDFGNSPVDAAEAFVAGRSGVLFTTNGTAALCALAGRATVISGALANLNAVAEFARQFERVVVVCAGNGQGTVFSEEDFAAAGAVIGLLGTLEPTVVVGEQATVASALDAVTEISNAPHAELLRTLGLGSDIEFCVRADTSQAVPLVVDFGDGWALLRDSSRRLA